MGADGSSNGDDGELDGTPQALAVPSLTDIDKQLSLDDFSGALALARARLLAQPECEKTSERKRRCETMLCEMHWASLGGARARVTLLKSEAEFHWLALDAQQAFVLSRIEDGIGLDDLLDVAGMGRLETLSLLTSLREQGVLGIAQDEPDDRGS